MLNVFKSRLHRIHKPKCVYKIKKNKARVNKARVKKTRRASTVRVRRAISKYNDNICIDNFNCSNSDTIFMRGTCPNAVQALTIFPQLMSLSAFSFMISIAIFLNLKEVCINNTDNNSIVSETELCVLDQLREIRLRNPKKVTMGHLNINSIPNKFDGIMEIVENHLDIFLISETKIDDSFPIAQFCFNGYSKPHRKDRAFGAGGLLMYVNENIPSRKLNELTLPDDIELMCLFYLFFI